MIKQVVYPGSFDPVTNGHLDIIKRTANTFDKVTVAVLHNSSKMPLFSSEERVAMIKKVTRDISNVEVEVFDGLLVDYLNKKGATIIIKGLRALSDFEYEFQMALLNRKLSQNIETLFMMTSDIYSYISSSVVKDVAQHGGNVNGLVPDEIVEEIYSKFKS